MKILAALSFVVAMSISSNAEAASYNCDARNLSPQENTICSVRDLNDMDVEMATTYRLLGGLLMMGTRGNMYDSQRAWLARRAQCGTDVSCLRKSYQRRIQQLNAIYDQLDRPL